MINNNNKKALSLNHFNNTKTLYRIINLMKNLYQIDFSKIYQEYMNYKIKILLKAFQRNIIK